MQKLGADNMGEPVAAHLHHDLISLREDQTVSDALAQSRRADITDKIVYLYVLDKDERLVGVVPVRRLLASEPGATMKSIMVAPVVSVSASGSVLEACETLLDHRFLALPVVDDENRLLGVIDLSQFTDELLTTAQHQVDSAFQLIGVHVALGRRVSSWASFKDRFPWLLCNMASGTICALIAGQFDLLLSEVVILAMFITVVLALGESVSMQSMTITLQGLLGQQTSWRQMLAAARKELATSALLGLGCGSIIGLTALIWRGTVMEGVAIGASILLSIVSACLLGVAIPTLIHRLRIDPKVAAGPIVLASADIVTLLYYFNIAQRLLA
ncbi:MAG TPA: CBS domain-containing protein [Phycisphaerae bacterium]|nr:CBS domain-containing protein [Phycisphaerae bacterium]HNU46425.1 CBS domain-containing protein [Phycisphaerae bacterium]